MKRFSRNSVIRTWLSAGILCSSVVLPGQAQDVDVSVPEPTVDNFTPLPKAFFPDDLDTEVMPAPFDSEEEVPEAFSDPEVNAAELDAGPRTDELTPQQTGMVKQTLVERQRVFMGATANAEAMLKTGRDSFERGLMPLDDYADLAQSALEIRLSIAALQNDRGARVSALIAHSDLMRSAAKQLKDLNQPSSTGWAADTAYAALLSSNADLRLAAARGDRDSYNAAVARSQELAEIQYDLRAEDFDQGLASLPAFARAASYLTTDVGLPAGNRADQDTEPTKFSEYLSKLEDVVEQTRQFAEQESGVGREDRLHQAEFELARAKGQLALKQRDRQAAIDAFDKAIDASEKWYESQLKFHESGTASLRDVTQAWWSRVELTDLSERVGLKPDKATLATTDDQLSELKRLVAAQADRQGRIAADVAYVKSLESLQGLWARQRAVALAAKSNPVQKPTVRSSRILELGANPQAKPTAQGIPGTTPVVTEKTNQTTIEIVRPQRSKPRK